MASSKSDRFTLTLTWVCVCLTLTVMVASACAEVDSRVGKVETLVRSTRKERIGLSAITFTESTSFAETRTTNLEE